MELKLNWKVFVANFLAVIMFIPGLIFLTDKPDVCMIGHRGYSGKYPDNTELSFMKAAEKGFGGAETDVRLTKDGVFVLSHDDEIFFEDGTTAVISENNYADLVKKPLKNEKTRKDKVYLCTFERYLEIMRDNDMVCFIELKGAYTDDEIKELFELADEVYDLPKCILQSFNFDNLVKTKNMFPELPVMLTYGTNDTDYERCFEYGISIDANLNQLTDEMVEAFHERGLLVATYTANTIFRKTYCKSFGVDFIESDYFAK